MPCDPAENCGVCFIWWREICWYIIIICKPACLGIRLQVISMHVIGFTMMYSTYIIDNYKHSNILKFIQ